MSGDTLVPKEKREKKEKKSKKASKDQAADVPTETRE